MKKPKVSVVSYREPYQTLKEALDLCGGLKNLSKEDNILIKPNLVAWDFDLPFPPYGVVTTSAVMFNLVKILVENGFTRLTIGEGPLTLAKPVGQAIFKVLGYEKLREKYGVDLVDFNEDKFVEVDYGEMKLSIARRALEADKIINVPVLKTHNQCKVSLGIKNLKGCLNKKSKMQCHGRDLDLNCTFPLVSAKLPVALTVIDGVFTLEKGPSNTGKAFRKNLIIASTDMLACDIVGTEIMDYRPADIEHLKFFAMKTGRSLDLKDIEVVGENIDKHRQYVDFDWEWTPEDTGPVGFAKRGITGLAIRKYDSSLCTGCSAQYNPMLILMMSAFRGEPFPGVEILSGKRQAASPGFEKTVLFGKCACELNKDNPNIKKAIRVKGCPPKQEDFINALKEEGIECSMEAYTAYRHYLFNRYKAEDGFDMGLFGEQEI
ncbi:MAG: DUF362 domain-containing protein [Peptococcaceae bacterium]|nr:DUF362 domain-containing protein [Peptococcaceae bacterium]